jgi:hypothetical protein
LAYLLGLFCAAWGYDLFYPKEVYGEDFPGETFRVLKEREIKQFEDASRRTRRLVLEAWDKLGQG